MTKRVPTLLAVAALSLPAAACGDDQGESAAAGTATEMATPEPMAAPAQDILGVAQGESSLSTLVQAVTAADLATTLKGDGPYTVFAPTNDAFRAVGRDTLDELLAPRSKDQLTSILTYHVVAGDVMASELGDGQTIETLQGQELTVSIAGDQVRIGDATVVQPDVDASNGTVHVIDSVLQPEA